MISYSTNTISISSLGSPLTDLSFDILSIPHMYLFIDLFISQFVTDSAIHTFTNPFPSLSFCVLLFILLMLFTFIVTPAFSHLRTILIEFLYHLILVVHFQRSYYTQSLLEGENKLWCNACQWRTPLHFTSLPPKAYVSNFLERQGAK